MNIHEAQRIAPVITAFANGKEIEYKYKNGQWISSTEPTFCPDYEWRIKPELKYRQYTFEEAKRLINCIIKHKNFSTIYSIEAVGDVGVYIVNQQVRFDSLLDNYTDINGKPLGVLL